METRLFRNKKIKIGTSIVLMIMGILAVIFAILKLAGKGGASPDTAFRIIIGIVFLAFGLTTLIILSIKADELNRVKQSIIGGSLIGVGVFFFTSAASSVINIIADSLLPIIVACIGGAIMIKAIIGFARKEPKRPTIFTLIAGAIILSVGIVFAVLSLVNVTWVILGAVIICVGVYELIAAIRSKEDDKVSDILKLAAYKKIKDRVEARVEEAKKEEIKEAVAVNETPKEEEKSPKEKKSKK